MYTYNEIMVKSGVPERLSNFCPTCDALHYALNICRISSASNNYPGGGGHSEQILVGVYHTKKGWS